MWKNYNKYRVLSAFFDNPDPKGSGLQLREISRGVNLAPKSVGIYLKQLEKELLITKEIDRNRRPTYRANRDYEPFKLYKRLDMVSRIHESGLLDFIYERLTPDCIILFGSASKGEDTYESDIDIFVQCKEKEIHLGVFEKKLKRKISLFSSKDFSKLSSELKNNVINGIILKGYLKVF